MHVRREGLREDTARVGVERGMYCRCLPCLVGGGSLEVSLPGVNLGLAWGAGPCAGAIGRCRWSRKGPFSSDRQVPPRFLGIPK